MNLGDLSNEKWKRLEPLLPPQKPTTGRPANDHRTMVNEILWVLRTGAPRRDLPERYSPWSSVYSSFRRWKKAVLSRRLADRAKALSDGAGGKFALFQMWFI